MIINRQDFKDSSRRTDSPVRAISLSDTIQSSFRTTRALELSTSANDGLAEAYSEVVTDIYNQSGVRLFNPYSGSNISQLTRGILGMPSASPKYFEEEFYRQVNKLRENNPDLDVPTPEQVRERVGIARSQLRSEDAEVQVGEAGLSSGVARFAGAAGAIMTDPLVLGSMIAGAPAASGVLRTALIESGIAAGVEVPIQGIVQSQRRQFGEEPSLGEAAANVVMAGAGGFVGGALLKGAAVGTRGLVNKYRASPVKKTPATETAATYLDRLHQIQDSNVLGYISPKGNKEFLDKWDESYYRVFSGDIYNKPRFRLQEPRNAIRDSSAAFEKDLAAYEKGISAFRERVGKEASRISNIQTLQYAKVFKRNSEELSTLLNWRNELVSNIGKRKQNAETIKLIEKNMVSRVATSNQREFIEVEDVIALAKIDRDIMKVRQKYLDDFAEADTEVKRDKLQKSFDKKIQNRGIKMLDAVNKLINTAKNNELRLFREAAGDDVTGKAFALSLIHI